MVSLLGENLNLVAYCYLSASKIWPDKRCGIWWWLFIILFMKWYDGMTDNLTYFEGSDNRSKTICLHFISFKKKAWETRDLFLFVQQNHIPCLDIVPPVVNHSSVLVPNVMLWLLRLLIQLQTLGKNWNKKYININLEWFKHFNTNLTLRVVTQSN